MKVKDIGEFGLIDRIAGFVAMEGGGARVGVGDDTAVLSIRPGYELLATADAMIDGVHFRLETTTPYQVGARAMAVNLSDIAAMGGVPRYVLVSLGLPAGCSVEFVDELYRGMVDLARRYGAIIAGGNLTSAPQVIIDVTLLGEAKQGRALLRSGARVGDSVMVTGTLGDSAAGLALLSKAGIAAPEEAARYVIGRHLSPTPRIEAGQALADWGGCTSMIDISDGLVGDAWHICDASGTGMVLDAASIPISPLTGQVAALMNRDPLSLALYGGEDYELLLTVPPGQVSGCEKAAQPAGGVALTRVGEVVHAGAGVQLRSPDGSVASLPRGGHDHFRSKKEQENNYGND